MQEANYITKMRALIGMEEQKKTEVQTSWHLISSFVSTICFYMGDKVWRES